jgi:hypothetical protein
MFKCINIGSIVSGDNLEIALFLFIFRRYNKRFFVCKEAEEGAVNIKG